MKRKLYQPHAKAVVLNGSGKGGSEMAKTCEGCEELKVELETAHDALKDIYDILQEVGSTRAELTEGVDKAIKICTDEIPDLSEDDEDSDDDSDDDDSDDDNEEEES